MPCLVITIVGEPVPGGNRFHVDFVRGHDVVFHFSPHFHENTIVRNTQLGGCWGPEERHGGFPFVQGRQFEVQHSDLPLEKELKGIVHPKMKILSSFTQHEVVAIQNVDWKTDLM
uniref:Galectin n=1 Tax=Cyprinus carpio TaxID=7962 RepID=A0A8C2FK49_CYPCA